MVDGAGILLVLVMGLGGILLYLWPTLRARDVKHPDVQSIFIVNIFLGWLLIPWVIALAWAYRAPKTKVDSMADKYARLKKCPFCAEEVRAEAIRCRHCHADITSRNAA
jgi:hypothetical protein